MSGYPDTEAHRWDHSSFVRHCRVIMEAENMTRQDLATACAISEATISRFLAGTHRPSIQTAASLAAVLRLSLDPYVMRDPTKWT